MDRPSTPLVDPTSPVFRAHLGGKLATLATQPLRDAAAAFDVELLYLARRSGLRLREVPVRWNHAEGSKVSFFRDSLRMLREVITVRRSVEALNR